MVTKPFIRRVRAFSMVEMLIALTVSATLLASALVALDVMFKRYTVISDSASTHLVARTVMHRMLAMIRTGEDFGPYPADVLNTATNPADYSYIEFVSERDSSGNVVEITRIEKRASNTSTIATESIALRGPNTLWLKLTRFNPGATAPSVNERPLLDGVSDCKFNLEYAAGPRLVRATIDMTILPTGNVIQKNDGTNYTSTVTVDGNTVTNEGIATDATSETIRLVASTSPRGND